MVKKKHAIYQNIEYTSLENKGVEPVKPVQINIYQSNYLYIEKNLSWLHFDNEPRIQYRQQVKGQQSYISLFVVYLTISSTS